MNFSNRDFDLADRRADQERAEGLRRVMSAMAGTGTNDCIDCLEAIDPARRKAMPTACRCAGCQSDFESKA
ncbi:TraR/DksA C4-type zinc finger protein [Devosia sp. J2-20]|uniref:TraR/DksA C4-type zinc finger protein n=1 Tax=Devosia sp. J2-20 TaxID=3026161 RepID=UPI002499B7E1|nr:TraR/DksA C4-type zinc finger protein [Devosia sp. J2-20]WDR00734.1 TraR/DksA C4-type zinc finger protein [Devosia sp. J2-20]